MHVSGLSLFFMYSTLIISVGLPVGLGIWFYRREKVSWKLFVIGAVTWFVTTQIFEKLLHFIVIGRTPILRYPFLFALYGAFAAAIFEEGARYLVYTKFLKNQTKWKDGVAYGIGHGGIEAIFIGFLTSSQMIGLSQLLNSGKLSQLKGIVSAKGIAQIKENLLGPSYLFLLVGFERLMALIIQIALSLVVLYAIRTKNMKVFGYAILLHAVFDFIPALYQAQSVNLFLVEGSVFLFFLASLAFIRRSRKLFS